MATEKLSVTLEAELVAELREHVGKREVSSYVNEAVKLALQRDRIRRMLEEMERDDGPIPPEILEEARARWRRPIQAD